MPTYFSHHDTIVGNSTSHPHKNLQNKSSSAAIFTKWKELPLEIRYAILDCNLPRPRVIYLASNISSTCKRRKRNNLLRQVLYDKTPYMNNPAGFFMTQHTKPTADHDAHFWKNYEWFSTGASQREECSSSRVLGIKKHESVLIDPKRDTLALDLPPHNLPSFLTCLPFLNIQNLALSFQNPIKPGLKTKELYETLLLAATTALEFPSLQNLTLIIGSGVTHQLVLPDRDVRRDEIVLVPVDPTIGDLRGTRYLEPEFSGQNELWRRENELQRIWSTVDVAELAVSIFWEVVDGDIRYQILRQKGIKVRAAMIARYFSEVAGACTCHVKGCTCAPSNAKSRKDRRRSKKLAQNGTKMAYEKEISRSEIPMCHGGAVHAKLPTKRSSPWKKEYWIGIQALDVFAKATEYGDIHIPVIETALEDVWKLFA